MKTVLAALAACAVWGAFHATAAAWPDLHARETHSYPFARDGVLAVEDKSGDVKVTGWNGDTLQVIVKKSSWSDADLARLGATIATGSGRTAIAVQMPDNCLNCDVSLDIEVPSGANVLVDTASGDVDIDEVAGPIRVDSGSGDITVSHATGQVRLRAESGDIKATDVSGPIAAYASSGDITAVGQSGNVDLATSSGSIRADFSEFDAVRTARMASASGDVTVVVPRGSGFMLDATTASGEIQSDLQLPVHERDGGADVSAQVGDGAASMQLRATSGDIKITMR